MQSFFKKLRQVSFLDFAKYTFVLIWKLEYIRDRDAFSAQQIKPTKNVKNGRVPGSYVIYSHFPFIVAWPCNSIS